MGLEATLSDPRKKYQDKVNALLSSWEHVASLITAVSEESCTTLIQWAIRHTLVLVLQGGWPNLSPAIKTHLNVTLQRCSVLLGHHKDANLCRYLMSLVSDPWGHKVLRREPAEVSEVIDFCKAEEEFLSVRLEILCDSKCEDIALQISQTCFKGLWTIKSQLIDSGLKLFHSLTDFYLALLYKRKRVDLMLQELHFFDLQDGLSVIRRCTVMWSKKSQRIWKNSGRIAIILSNFFMTKAMVTGVTGGVLFLDFLKEWALLQSNNYHNLEKLSEDVRKLIQSAPSAIQIYSFSEILVKQFGDKLKSLCIELYIRALTTDMNELEQQKAKKDKEKVRETEIRLSNGFLQLAELAKEVVGISRECILTAFSLNPIQSIYEKLKDVAIACGKCSPERQIGYDKLNELSKACDKISPQQQKILERDKEIIKKSSIQNNNLNEYSFNENHPWNTFNQITGIDSLNKMKNSTKCETCPIHNHYIKNHSLPCTCGSNISSSINPDNNNANQPILNENTIQESNNYDVFSAPNKVLDDAEKLGLSPQLCDDLAVVLSNPRYHILSWILDWSDLNNLCEKYLVNSEGMRNLNKELKYLNIDYTQFKNLPSVTEYLGIEKGYEKWAEDSNDQDSSSSDYKRPRPRKFKLETDDSNGSNSSFSANYTHRSRSRSNGRDPTRKMEKNSKVFWNSISDSESTTQDSYRADSVCGDDFTNEAPSQKDTGKQKNISHILYDLGSKNLTNDLNSIMLFSQMADNVNNSDSLEFKQSLNYLLKSNNNKRNPDRLRNLRMYRRENCSPISQSNCKILGSSIKQDLKFDFAPRLSTLNLNPRIVLTRTDISRDHQKNNIFTSTTKNNDGNYKISTTSTTSSTPTTTTTSTATTTTTSTTTITSSISTTSASTNINIDQVHNKIINKVNQKNLYTSDNFYSKSKYRHFLHFDKSRFHLSHSKHKMNKLGILTKLVIDDNILAKTVPGLNSLDMIVPPQSESTVQVVQVTQNHSHDSTHEENHHLPALNQNVPNLNQSVMNNEVNTHNIPMNNTIPIVPSSNQTTVSSSSVIQSNLSSSTSTITRTSLNTSEDSKLNVQTEVKYLTTTSEVSEILRSTLEENVTPENVSEMPSKNKSKEKTSSKKNDSLSTQPTPSGNTLPVVKGVDYVIANLINSVANNESTGTDTQELFNGTDTTSPHSDSSQTFQFLYKSDDGKIHIKPIICSPINKNNETNDTSTILQTNTSINQSSQTKKEDIKSKTLHPESFKDQSENIPIKVCKETSIASLPKFHHVFGKNIYNQSTTGLIDESSNKSNTTELINDNETTEKINETTNELISEIKSNTLETNSTSTLQSKAVQTTDHLKLTETKNNNQMNNNITHSEEVNASTSQEFNFKETKKIQSSNVPNQINIKNSSNIFENKPHLSPIINVKNTPSRHFLSVLGNIDIAQKNTSTKPTAVDHQNESNVVPNLTEQITNQHQTSSSLSNQTSPNLNKDSVIRNRMNALLAAALTRPVINTITTSSSTNINCQNESETGVKENSSDEDTAKSISQTVQRITLPVIQKNPRQILRTRIVTPVIQLPNGQIVSRSQMVALPNRRTSSNQQPVLMTPTSSPSISLSNNSRHTETIIPPSEPTQLSSTTLEQLREFESVLEQVTNTSQMKERGGTNASQTSNQIQNNTVVTAVTGPSNTTIIPKQIILPVSSNCNAEFITSVSRTSSTFTDTFPVCSTNTSRVSVTYVTHSSTIQTTTSPVVVVTSYCQSASSPALSVTSQSSSSPCVTPGPSTSVSIGKTPKTTQTKSSKTKTIKTTPTATASKASPIPKPQQKPQEDEQTAQRIYAILDEYAEQLRNSPDLNNKPAPRRRSNPPTNPSQSSKRKKSSQSKVKLLGQSNLSCEMSPGTDDPRTMGSEDSSSGIVQLNSVQDSPNPQTSIPEEQITSKLEESSISVSLNEISEQNIERPHNRLIFTDTSRVPGRTVIVQDSLPQSVDNVAVSVSANTVVTGKSVVVGNTTLPLYLPGSVRQVLLPVPQGLTASVQGRPVVVSKGSKVIRVTVPSNALQMGTTTAGVQGAALVVRQMCVNKPVVPITGTTMSVIGQPTTMKQVKLPLGSLTTQPSLASNLNQTSILIPTSTQDNISTLTNEQMNVNTNNKQTKDSFASVSSSLTTKLVQNNTFHNISSSLIPDTRSVVSVNVTNNLITKAISSTYNEEFSNQEISESATHASSLRFTPANVIQNSSAFSSKLPESQNVSSIKVDLESVNSDKQVHSESSSHSKNTVISPSTECSKSLDFPSTPKNLLLSRTTTGINKQNTNFPSNRNLEINVPNTSRKLNSNMLSENSEIQNYKRCNKEHVTFNVSSTTMDQTKSFNPVSSINEKNDYKNKKHFSYISNKSHLKEEFENEEIDSAKTNIADRTCNNSKIPWRFNADLKTFKNMSPTHKLESNESSALHLEDTNIELDDSSLENMEDKKLLNSYSSSCSRNMKEKSSERFSIFQPKLMKTERSQHLFIQKSLSEECEDLGVDEPSTSDLFPEADILLDINSSPSFEHNIESNSQSIDNFSKYKQNIEDSSSTEEKENKASLKENTFSTLNSQENPNENHKSQLPKNESKTENSSYYFDKKSKPTVSNSENKDGISYKNSEFGKIIYSKDDEKNKSESQISSSTSLEEQNCSQDNYDSMYDKDCSFTRFEERISDGSTRISSSSENNHLHINWKEYSEQESSLKSNRSPHDINEKQRKFTPQVMKKLKSINDRNKIVFSKDQKPINEKLLPTKRSAESSSSELTKKIKTSIKTTFHNSLDAQGSCTLNKDEKPILSKEEMSGTSYETDLEKDYKEAIQFVARLPSKSLDPPELEENKTLKKVRSRQSSSSCNNDTNENLIINENTIATCLKKDSFKSEDHSTKQIIDHFDFEISSEDSRPFSPYNSYVNEKELRNSQSNISNLFDDAISYPSEDDKASESCQNIKNRQYKEIKKKEYSENRVFFKSGFDKIYCHKKSLIASQQVELKNEVERYATNNFSNLKTQFNCSEKNNIIEKNEKECSHKTEILSSFKNDRLRNRNLNNPTPTCFQHAKSQSSLIKDHESKHNGKSLPKFEEINLKGSKLPLDSKKSGKSANICNEILVDTQVRPKQTSFQSVNDKNNTEHIIFSISKQLDIKKNNSMHVSDSVESNQTVSIKTDLKNKKSNLVSFNKEKSLINNQEGNSIYTNEEKNQDLSIMYDTVTNNKDNILNLSDIVNKELIKGKGLDIIYKKKSILKSIAHNKHDSLHIVEKKDAFLNCKRANENLGVLTNSAEDKTDSSKYLENLPSISSRKEFPMSTPSSYIKQCSKLKNSPNNLSQEGVINFSKENSVKIDFPSTNNEIFNNCKLNTSCKNKLNASRVTKHQTFQHSSECPRTNESQNYAIKIPESEENKCEKNMENNNDVLCNNILSGVKRYKRHQGDTLLPLVEPVQSKFMYTYGKQKHSIRNRKLEEFHDDEKEENMGINSEKFNINLPSTNGCDSEVSSNSYDLTDHENFSDSPEFESNFSESEISNKHSHYLSDDEKEPKIQNHLHKNVCEKSLNEEYYMNSHESKGRRASARDQIRKGCNCCNGSPERPKKKYIKLEKTKKLTHLKTSNNKLIKKR